MITVDKFRFRQLSKSAHLCAFLFALCWLFVALPVYSQPVVSLWNIDTARLPSLISPPVKFIIAQPVRLNPTTLDQLQVGARYEITVEELSQVFAFTSSGLYPNGDRVFSASLNGDQGRFPLVLTRGEDSVFASLTTGTGVWQLFAVMDEDRGYYSGWLYKPAELAGLKNGLSNDYVIPDVTGMGAEQVVKPQELDRLTLAYITSNDSLQIGGAEQTSATIDTVTGINFELIQQISSTSVLPGTSVEIIVSVENISAGIRQDVALEIFFVLENSELIAATEGCNAQLSLSGQEVLHCDLGSLLVGEIKTIRYTVRVSVLSKPYIISAAFVGNIRSDVFVYVVTDVVTDTDGDGISDINEGFLGTDPFDPESVDHSNAVIDVMALYTPGAEELYGGAIDTRINQLISVANQLYKDSDVGITLRPVYHGVIEYNDVDDMDTALGHLTFKTHQAFDQVDFLRKKYGADLVMLFRPMNDVDDRCGLTNLGGFNTSGDFSNPTEKDFAYSHLSINCPNDIVVAHELGHNMGLTHSEIEDGRGGTFPFSRGYGVDGEFATVMAYPGAFRTDVRVARHSNPHIECLGLPCGVDADDQEHGANAALSLNLVRFQIADYFPKTVQDLPFHRSIKLDGTETHARIAIAATTDSGLSLRDSVAAGESFDVNVDIHVPDEQLNREAFIYVLLSLGDQGIVQVGADGELLSWDGTVESLVAFTVVSSLNTLQRFKVINHYAADVEMVGQNLAIYIAYHVQGSDDFIYTVEPLVLEITEEIVEEFVEIPKFSVYQYDVSG